MTFVNFLYGSFRKIIFFALLVPLCFVFLGVFTLKSTSFDTIYTPNKTIIAMKPIYSAGDPMPAAIVASRLQPQRLAVHNQRPANIHYPNIQNHAPMPAVNAPLRYATQNFTNKRPALNNPLSIIPNHTQARKSFYRPYIQAVNAYINPKTNNNAYTNVAFQANIPSSNTIKQLRPTQKSVTIPKGRMVYVLPVYKEYASIKKY